MKANELMIGDWVCTEHDSTPRQIDWIRTGEIGLLWGKVATPPRLIPIPLTKEILEKNGIKYQYGMPWYQYGDGRVLEFHYVSDDLTKDVKVCIEFIHQLQHAMRLCGIDTEIVL